MSVLTALHLSVCNAPSIRARAHRMSDGLPNVSHTYHTAQQTYRMQPSRYAQTHEPNAPPPLVHIVIGVSIHSIYINSGAAADAADAEHETAVPSSSIDCV